MVSHGSAGAAKVALLVILLCFSPDPSAGRAFRLADAPAAPGQIDLAESRTGASKEELLSTMIHLVSEVKATLDVLDGPQANSARTFCKPDDILRDLQSGNDAAETAAARLFASDCFPIILSGIQQVDGLTTNIRSMAAELKEAERKFAEAQAELEERITAQLEEQAGSGDEADVAMEEEKREQLRVLRALHATFTPILESLKDEKYRENFASEIEEGEKISKIYGDQFPEDVTVKKIPLTMLEAMSSLMRNWISNLGLGFRIYLKLYNRPPRDTARYHRARFTVYDGNTMCRVDEMDGTKKESTREFGPFFYVVDGAPMDVVRSQTKEDARMFARNSNTKLFMSMEPWLQLLVNDQNDAFVIAYGNTGSGKTFTLLEDSSSFVPSVVSYFERASDKVESFEYTALEYTPGSSYTRSKINLLSADPSARAGDYESVKWIAATRDKPSAFYAKGSSPSYSELPFVRYTTVSFANAVARRTTRATGANAVSSRSHAVFIFKVKLVGKSNPRYLTVFDLAGLETASQGGKVDETNWIKNSFHHFQGLFDTLLTGGDIQLYTRARAKFSAADGPSHLLAQFMADRGRVSRKKVKIALVGTAVNDYDAERTNAVLEQLMSWGETAQKALEMEIALRKENKSLMDNHGGDSYDEEDDTADTPDVAESKSPEPMAAKLTKKEKAASHEAIKTEKNKEAELQKAEHDALSMAKEEELPVADETQAAVKDGLDALKARPAVVSELKPEPKAAKEEVVVPAISKKEASKEKGLEELTPEAAEKDALKELSNGA